MQSKQQGSSGIISLQIASEDPSTAEAIDIAFAGEIGRGVEAQLQQDGYAVSIQEDPEQKQKGGVDVWMQVVYIATEVWQHRQEIEQGISDLSALYSIFQGVSGIVHAIAGVYKKHTQSHPDEVANPCKITITVDNAAMTIEADHLPEKDEIVQLTKHFAEQHPKIAQQASAKSKVSVQGKLPKRTTRKRKGRR